MKIQVRSFIGYVLTLLICYLGVMGKIEAIEIIAIYGPIVGFYFGEKSALKQPPKQ